MKAGSPQYIRDADEKGDPDGQAPKILGARPLETSGFAGANPAPTFLMTVPFLFFRREIRQQWATNQSL